MQFFGEDIIKYFFAKGKEKRGIVLAAASFYFEIEKKIGLFN